MHDGALSWANSALSGLSLALARITPVAAATLACSLLFALVLPFTIAFARARKRRLLFQSGVPLMVDEAVEAECVDDCSPGTLRAFAYAALGRLGAARRTLMGQGTSVDASTQELTLCTHILIAAFEGEPVQSLQFCEQLLFLPPRLNSARSHARRAGVVAIARAQAGWWEEDDLDALSEALTHEPVLFWASRFAVASVCQRRGRPSLARRLIEEAPSFPEESCFCGLSRQLLNSTPQPPVGDGWAA